MKKWVGVPASLIWRLLSRLSRRPRLRAPTLVAPWCQSGRVAAVATRPADPAPVVGWAFRCGAANYLSASASIVRLYLYSPSAGYGLSREGDIAIHDPYRHTNVVRPCAAVPPCWPVLPSGVLRRAGVGRAAAGRGPENPTRRRRHRRRRIRRARPAEGEAPAADRVVSGTAVPAVLCRARSPAFGCGLSPGWHRWMVRVGCFVAPPSVSVVVPAASVAGRVGVAGG